MIKSYAFIPTMLFLSIGYNAFASQADDGPRYVCSQGRAKAFSPNKTSGCIELRREAGWQNAVSSPEMIVDFEPKTFVRDNASAKVWLRFYMNQSFTYTTRNGVSRGKFDGMKGVYRFNCGKREQVLIQADYTLGARLTYARLSDEAVTEEIEADTVAEGLYTTFCPNG